MDWRPSSYRWGFEPWRLEARVCVFSPYIAMLAKTIWTVMWRAGFSLRIVERAKTGRVYASERGGVEPSGLGRASNSGVEAWSLV